MFWLDSNSEYQYIILCYVCFVPINSMSTEYIYIIFVYVQTKLIFIYSSGFQPVCHDKSINSFIILYLPVLLSIFCENW